MSTRITLSAAFASLLVVGTATICQAQDLTVSGIALKSDFSAAVENLRSKGFQIQPYRIATNPDIAKLPPQQMISASKGNDDEYTIQGLNGRIVLIIHKIRFKAGTRPNTNTTMGDLKAKLGPWTSFSQPDASMHNYEQSIAIVWNLDVHGHAAPQRGPGSLNNCGAGVGPSEFSPAPLHPDRCTNYVRADLFTERDINLLQTLTLLMVDQAPIDDYRARFLAIVRGKADAKDNAAKQNKAPL